MYGLIGCPYCYGLIMLTDKQVEQIEKIFKEGKNGKFKCPYSTCGNEFLITPKGRQKLPITS